MNPTQQLAEYGIVDSELGFEHLRSKTEVINDGTLFYNFAKTPSYFPTWNALPTYDEPVGNLTRNKTSQQHVSHSTSTQPPEISPLPPATTIINSVWLLMCLVLDIKIEAHHSSTDDVFCLDPL